MVFANHDVKNKIRQKAYILGIELNDDTGKNTNNILMGSNVIFRLHYKQLNKEDIHFNFILKNKNDLVVTTVGLTQL